ncbi:hypothetical protein lerEdw1_002346 [Lerista edwardsae]|nr:hypothetical protein lerEdw1_002346 [Lerista edwardsae]
MRGRREGVRCRTRSGSLVAESPQTRVRPACERAAVPTASLQVTVASISLVQMIPQGSFQDELDWCISQLETGLLRQNPTPKQAEETRRVLGVLRSRKAPFVKKRQVMHRVFGDYRLQMAEERKRAAKAALKPVKVQIQPGDALSSGSVVYRKQSSQPPETQRSWFAPSDNSFQFGFDLSERAEISGPVGVGASEEPCAGSGPSPQDDENGRLDFSTAAEMPGFAFNFVIPNSRPFPSAECDPGFVAAAENATEGDSPSSKTTTLENSTCPNPDRPDAMGGTRRGGKECPKQGIPPLETPHTVLMETKESTGKEGKLAAGAGDSSKKKKRKKRQPSKVEPSGSANGDSKHPGKGALDQAEPCQPSDEQLKREVDWCVEQLELGLKTQKSTPKQKDEALRAVKTLRSGKAALAKKRQVMRAMFGDYRTKMAEERRKQLKLMQTGREVRLALGTWLQERHVSQKWPKTPVGRAAKFSGNLLEQPEDARLNLHFILLLPPLALGQPVLARSCLRLPKKSSALIFSKEARRLLGDWLCAVADPSPKMDEAWVAYLVMVLLVVTIIVMKQKPDDEVKREKEADSRSTPTTYYGGGSGRAQEFSEEEMAVSMERLTSVMFSSDPRKREPHQEHRSSSSGKEVGHVPV